MGVPSRPCITAKVCHVGDLRVTVAVLVQRKNSHAFRHAVLSHPPSQEEGTRRGEDPKVSRPHPTPLSVGAWKGSNGMVEQWVPFYGEHELVRHAKRRRPRKHHLSLEKRVDGAEAMQVQIRINPSEFSQDHIPGGVDSLNGLGIALIQGDEFGRPLPNECGQVLVRPEAVLPVGEDWQEALGPWLSASTLEYPDPLSTGRSTTPSTTPGV